MRRSASTHGSPNWPGFNMPEGRIDAGASLVSLLRATVAEHPDAIVAIDAGVSEPRSLTARALWQRVVALRQELAERGVGPDGCVAVWLPNWSDALVWQFAAAMLGAHVIGVNTRYNVEEVGHLLDRARPTVIAVAHEFVKLDLDVRLRKAASLCSGPLPSVAVVAGPHRAPATPEELGRYDIGAGAWVPAEPGAMDAVATTDAADFPDRLAVAFSTSGSTGQPKLATHTSRAAAGHALAVAAAGGWQRGDVTLCALPLSGVFAFVPALATLACGATCLLEPSFNADTIVADMARFGVTHVVGADDIVGRLVEAWKQQPCELPRWRRLLLADFNGRSAELAEWAERQFGLTASGVYGSSELFALTALWPATAPTPTRWRGGGQPASAHIEVRCADPDSGDVCAVGDTGELQFRGCNVVDAYLGAPELRAQQLTADGWFRSGDLGVMHDDGSFEYVCRAGDALRLKGFLVEPAEIEMRIAAHDAVEVVKVVGLRLPDGQTEAVAFVVLKAGTAPMGAGELTTWCARALARHKVPRSVHIIDEMPTTSGVNGTKIKTAELRLWAQQRETAQAAPQSPKGQS
jgi:fatty-acyl-CoA synthase